ncbi:unnamed protein product [Schistosoma intercalatum]|nr:unnamed protein product [Schistosoma intercalatum]
MEETVQLGKIQPQRILSVKGPPGPLIDSEYADDIVLFGEDADKMQSLLVALSNNARMFGMRFSPSKCKLLLQDWSALTPELRIGSEVVERVDNFTYLGSLISPNGWYRTKSQHGFEKLDWLLPTYVTYGEGEISVYQ